MDEVWLLSFGPGQLSGEISGLEQTAKEGSVTPVQALRMTVGLRALLILYNLWFIYMLGATMGGERHSMAGWLAGLLSQRKGKACPGVQLLWSFSFGGSRKAKGRLGSRVSEKMEQPLYSRKRLLWE